MNINAETLKFAGGAIIIATAALIMFPGILSYLAGLGRVAIFVGVAFAIGLALALAVRQIGRSRKSPGPSPSVAGSASDRADTNNP